MSELSELSETKCIAYLHREKATQIKCLSLKNNRAVFSVSVDRIRYAVKFFTILHDTPTYPFFAHRDILPALKTHGIRQRWRHTIIPDILRVEPDTEAGAVIWMSWIESSQTIAIEDRFKFENIIPVIQELKSIPVEQFLPMGLRLYENKAIQKDVDKSIKVLKQFEILKPSDVCSISKNLMPLFDMQKDRPLVLSNEDFRFANLIRINELTTAIVDWDGVRASRFEIEHCFAHMMLFMTDETETYLSLCQKVSQLNIVDKEIFKACNVLRSIIQLCFWRNHPRKLNFLLGNLKEMFSQY